MNNQYATARAVEGLPQPSLTSLADGLRGTSNTAMQIYDRLEVLLSRVRGAVPKEDARGIAAVATTPPLLDELNNNITAINDFHGLSSKALSELERLIGEKQ